MKNTTGEFEGREQRKLFFQSWFPEGNIKAHIIALHGWGTHSDRFKLLADYITEKGYTVHAFDLRGHWRNAGTTPGHIDSIDHIRNDLVLFIDFIKKDFGEKKLFLLGHSFGGLIIIKYAINRPNLDGIILSSPLLALQIKVPGAKKLLKKDPTNTIPFEIDQKLVTGDLKIVKEYLKDKNRIKSISANTYGDIMKEMKDVLSNAAGILCPIYMLQAGDEKVGDKKVNKKFFDNIKSEDKNYKEYALFLHELMAERMRGEVFQDIFVWLEKHSK